MKRIETQIDLPATPSTVGKHPGLNPSHTRRETTP